MDERLQVVNEFANSIVLECVEVNICAYLAGQLKGKERKKLTLFGTYETGFQDAQVTLLAMAILYLFFS